MILNLRRMGALVAVLLALGFISSATAQKQKEQKEQKAPKVGTPVIWSDPGAVENLDFVGGIGGRRNAPKPPFSFVEESMSGTNPKVRITDANGALWMVKFGSEVNAETFATRIAWAAGYFVEPAYFVPMKGFSIQLQLSSSSSFLIPLSWCFSNRAAVKLPSGWMNFLARLSGPSFSILPLGMK